MLEARLTTHRLLQSDSQNTQTTNFPQLLTNSAEINSAACMEKVDDCLKQNLNPKMK
jgi:hypothetical protein